MEKRSIITDIVKYLQKSYYISDHKYFVKSTNQHEWGSEICLYIVQVFSCDPSKSFDAFKQWSYDGGITDETWQSAWKPITLNTIYNPELPQDFALYGIVENVEARMAKLLCDEILKEINNDTLKKLSPYINNREEFFGVLKCIGYETTKTIYDVKIGKPYKNIVAARQHDILNERQNNDIWQNYFRSTRVDDQAQVAS